jgi:demethylmenaquinone methyltransferase/2-methoxy-6-polyprenyl-1,4-benzoquinol methylase
VRDLPVGATKKIAVQRMFDRIAPRYDCLNRLLTFRLDLQWRREAIRAIDLQPGDRLLDLACGTGDFLTLVEGTGARALGIDFSEGMLRHARLRGVPGTLIQADAARLPLGDGTVTALTCGFALRNFVSLDEVLSEAARVLAPGGRMALLEVDAPTSALLRWGHALYFHRVVPWLGGLLSDRAAYRYLPRSAAYLPPEALLLARIERAGFTRARKRRFARGASQLLTAVRCQAGAPTERDSA